MCSIAVGRSIGFLLAVTGIGLSIYWAYEALRIRRGLPCMADLESNGEAIDLSQPCEISLPFQQTCSISHGEGLYLQCDVETKLQAEPENLLKGLSGVVVFKDSDGRQIDTVKFDDKRARYWDDKILLTTSCRFALAPMSR